MATQNNPEEALALSNQVDTPVVAYIPKLNESFFQNYPELIEQGDNDTFAKTFNKISGDYWLDTGGNVNINNTFLSILIADFNQRHGQVTTAASTSPDTKSKAEKNAKA